MSEFKTRNDDFVARTQNSFARQNFMARLGASLHDVGAGSVETRLPYDEGLTHQHGHFHGGVIGTIADNAGGYAAFSLMAKTDSVLTVEYKHEHHGPGQRPDVDCMWSGVAPRTSRDGMSCGCLQS